MRGRDKPAPTLRRPHRAPARIGLYLLLGAAALAFLLPFYVMLVTSLKPMEEIRQGHLFAWPAAVTLEPWRAAWRSACTGVDCAGIRVGFWNSMRIVVPSTLLAILLGAWNGYALAFWRPRGGRLLFGILTFGAFIPVQVMMLPLVRLLAGAHLVGSLAGIVLVHVVFSMPLMTLLFRQYYLALPQELFAAARIDGGRFLGIFTALMLPLSVPMIVVAAIMQVTGVWNDYILGLVFAGRANVPMTVQLNNLINTTTGTRAYNVNMAATMLTSLVPLAIYFVSGRWFVRGIAAGAVKG